MAHFVVLLSIFKTITSCGQPSLFDLVSLELLPC